MTCTFCGQRGQTSPFAGTARVCTPPPSSSPVASSSSSRSSLLRFEKDPPTTSVSGICKFFGTLEHIPLFSVDFSAVPRCFMYMYYGMFLRFGCRNFVIVNKLINMDTDSFSLHFSL
ncbi:hypothetical protein SO802_009972 [Lithocarpus litseifolius]|uniref:Uncharacterized protein n=1 Tax=Lithocarpus litseifolius TaxID=425828 RepID=A0AAW2DH27_9ROSI